MAFLIALDDCEGKEEEGIKERGYVCTMQHFFIPSSSPSSRGEKDEGVVARCPPSLTPYSMVGAIWPLPPNGEETTAIAV